MTREEAISIMNVIVHMLEPQYDTDRIEDAVEMAINALEQEPGKRTEERTETHSCDYISRQTVLDILDRSVWKTPEELEVFELVKKLPSVNPLSVFDDIKAKLQRLADDEWNQNVGNCAQGMSDAIEIIDECIAESEDKE